MTSKAKLVYVNKSKVRPPEGTPEFDAWIEARSKARAKFYFDESRDVPDLAENTQFLCGSWDFLSQTDDEIDAENEAMEKAEELRKRENLKVSNSSIKCNHYAATSISDCPVNNS